MSRTDAIDELARLIERKGVLARSAGTASVSKRLQELRAWQAARLARTYGDLRGDPLAAGAMEFFLSDLYGPQDLTRRDRDVARAWPLLKRALPARALEILSLAMELDVLSTELDLEMARQMSSSPLTPDAYADAYRAVGRPEARRHQIRLIVDIGTALVRAVQLPLVRLALRAAHGPANLAGFGALQDFLERGFAAFRKLPHATQLLTTIEERETRLMEILFAGGPIPPQDSPASSSSPS